MLGVIRNKFGKYVIGGIIGFIAFVFVFYGVLSPRATRGLHEGAVAGKVNGDPITIPEFNRELNRRMEFFKNLGGGQLSEEQLKAFRVREGVFQELVRRKLMVQEADRQKLMASDEEVRERIREIPAFQKDGKFDLATYRGVLQANQHTPGSFERLMREDLSMAQWENYFRSRVHVSDEEIKREFLQNDDKRNIKYVLLTSQAGKKGVSVPAGEVQKFLGDPAKVNIAKGRFEAGKETLYKGKTFDAVKEEIARDVLAGEKTAEVAQVNQKLADQVVGMMTADKASDGKVNALLKSYGTEVKSTGPITRANRFLPGIGEAKELFADVFAKNSPIAPGGKAKKYSSAAWTMVAVVTDVQKPDLAKLDKERDSLMRQILMRKERDFYESWLKKIQDKASIDANPAVVGGES